MPASLKASVRHAAAEATLPLPFGFPDKEWFSIAEVAKLCGMSETFIEAVFDKTEHEGKGPLGGHKHNAGKGRRRTKRIPRAFVITYVLGTATYDNGGMIDEFVRVLYHQSEETLRQVSDAALRRADQLANARKKSA